MTRLKKKQSRQVVRSKKCGYIAYPVDYTKHQGKDPGANLKKGDEVEGYITSVKVEPYWVGKELHTKCSVPVFCSKDDPIEFEVALEKAVIRAGRVIDPKELKYGTIEEKRENRIRIPDGCLIVN